MEKSENLAMISSRLELDLAIAAKRNEVLPDTFVRWPLFRTQALLMGWYVHGMADCAFRN